MQEIKNLELIERYLNGQMSSKEKKEFEIRLTHDTSLAQDLEMMKIGGLIFEPADFIPDHSELKEELDEMGRQLLNQQTKKKPLFKLRSLLLVLLLLIIGSFVFFYFFFYPKSTPNNTKGPIALYDENFSYIDLRKFQLLGLSSDDQLTDSLWNKVLKSYQVDSCQAAILLIPSLNKLPSFKEKNKANLILGSCLIESDKVMEGIDCLRTIKPAALEYYQEAQWYTSLAYLKAKRTNNAIQLLDSISNNIHHPKQLAAQKILSLIDTSKVEIN